MGANNKVSFENELPKNPVFNTKLNNWQVQNVQI